MLESTGIRLNNKKPKGGKGQMNSSKPQDQRDCVGSKAMNRNSDEALESVRHLSSILFSYTLKLSKLMYLLFSYIPPCKQSDANTADGHPAAETIGYGNNNNNNPKHAASSKGNDNESTIHHVEEGSLRHESDDKAEEINNIRGGGSLESNVAEGADSNRNKFNKV